MSKQLRLYTDGGARGNPGPAGIGGVLLDGKQVVAEFSGYIGEATNNVAEYEALIRGLEMAVGKTDRLVCFLDSQLVVRQLNGIYRIKQPHLQRLVSQVRRLELKFSSVEYRHIQREANKEADALVNSALDANSSH